MGKQTALGIMLAVFAGASMAALPSFDEVDVNGDGFADLAIGVPGEDVEGKIDAGAVNVLYGKKIYMPYMPSIPLLLLDD